MLRAYLDASNEHARKPCVVISGFVATEKAWQDFESLWSMFLDEFRIRRFHNWDFWERRKQFQSWSDAKCDEAKARVCQIFSAMPAKPIGVGAGVALDEFEKWRLNQPRFEHPDPYYFCLDCCLHTLIRGITQYPNDDGVAIYVDQDQQREVLGQQIAQWHQDRLKRLPQINPNIKPDRNVSIHYVSSVDHKPLQLADILSNSSFRYMKDIMRNKPSLTEPYFVKCMQRANFGLAVHLMNTSEMIEMQARAKFHADDPV